MLRRRPVRATRLVPFVALVVLLASCGGSSSGAGSSDGGGGTTATTVAAKLFADNFTGVCQGAGMSQAREYAKTGTHKALYFETYKDSLLDQSTQLPADWTVQFDAKTNAYAAIDIVACGVRTAQTFLKDCTGYQEDGKDTGHTVKLYSATYTVTVHQATSGKTLGTTTMSADDSTCPSFQSFDEGETTVKSYDSPGKDKITAFLKPFIQP